MTNETLGGVNRFTTVTVKNLVVTGSASFQGAVTDNSDITLAPGKAVQTSTAAGNTGLFQAYDVNGTAYKTFATLTANDTPSFAIAAPSGGTVTIDGATIGDTTTAAGSFTTVGASGSVTLRTATSTLVLKQGANGKTGTFTLNGATPVAVGNTSVTANSTITFGMKTAGGTPGAFPSFVSVTPSTGFTVVGAALDTSVYNYIIVESAA